MTFAKLLPLTMVVLSVGASIVYGAGGDWRHCIYWMAAGVLTFTVTAF